jgi:FRG domain
MENSQDVRCVREFLERVWLKPQPADTEINLFRGQLDDHPLLPKLFRAPNTPSRVQEFEGKMLALLKQAAPHLAPSRPENDWDWLSLGQHYGMSTRMSDWSANALVALFFAVESDPEAQASPLVYHYPIKPEIVEKHKAASPLTIPHTRVFKPTTR